MRRATLNIRQLVRLGLPLLAVPWISGCALGIGQASRDADSKRLQKTLAAKNARIAELTAASESQLEAIRSLNEELERTREYLEYAEQQFISLERGLQSQETKASAVATLAEAKLAYDKRIRDDASAAQLANVRRAKSKIDKSESLLPQKRFAASVYFAKRAIRLLETAERTIIHVVAVSHANMRRGPGLEYKVVRRLSFGSVLIQTGDQAGWYKVETRDGKSGWVHESVTVAP